MGMVMCSLGILTNGGTLVYPCEGFKANMALKAVEHYKCNSATGVPTMYFGMIKEYKDNGANYDISSLTKAAIAGSLCPAELMKGCKDVLGIDLMLNAYGMTETSPLSTQCRADSSFLKKTTTVGKVFPHVEVKIADEKGLVIPRGEPGEICVRGYLVMLKYWNDPEKTKETIDENNWVRTGDIGIIDDEGYVEIVGRVRDMIIRGGENISPKEVENHIITHDGIFDVQVVGVHDETRGEEVMACIILENADEPVTREEIFEFLHGKIAYFKIPRYVRILKEFPLTVTGKVMKTVLRDDANKVLEEVEPGVWEVDHGIYV
jgi:fatty-acyl-CoA synthase